MTELTFKLKTEPEDKLVFKYKDEKTVVLELKVKNVLENRQTIKVKCTDNSLFRVRHPLSFIKAGETATVVITAKLENLKDPSGHYFAIYHMACDDMEKTAREVWTAESKPEGVHRIPVVFEKETEAEKDKNEEVKAVKNEGEEKNEEKNEEKKEEEKKEEEKKEEEQKDTSESKKKDESKE
ncbi:unnamed protein product [Auanema sp. JU1783]|nr:unnamed protein product [Auanema sp. JU1783]